MKSLDWNDMYISADEYFDILREAWEKSEFFDGWDKPWHPEDMHSNFEVVFDSVGQGITSYTHLIGKKHRAKTQSAASYAANDHTQVFGGTLPNGKWDEYFELSPKAPQHREFGDNV